MGENSSDFPTYFLLAYFDIIFNNYIKHLPKLKLNDYYNFIG